MFEKAPERLPGGVRAGGSLAGLISPANGSRVQVSLSPANHLSADRGQDPGVQRLAPLTTWADDTDTSGARQRIRQLSDTGADTMPDTCLTLGLTSEVNWLA